MGKMQFIIIKALVFQANAYYYNKYFNLSMYPNLQISSIPNQCLLKLVF